MSPFDLYLEREPGGTDFFDGEFVHFNGQTGAWTRGAKKIPIGSTVMFLSNMREIAIGWVKVVDSRIVDRQIGWVKDGYERPPREELDDRDDRRWPFNNRDEQEDPWKMTSYLPMRCLEDGEPVVFGPFAPTQLAAIKNLVQVFQRVNRGGKDRCSCCRAKASRTGAASTILQARLQDRALGILGAGQARPADDADRGPDRAAGQAGNGQAGGTGTEACRRRQHRR